MTRGTTLPLAAAEPLSSVLLGAGYIESRLAEALNVAVPLGLPQRENRLLTLPLRQRQDPLARLIRLFLLGDALSNEEIAAIGLASLPAGLLERDGSGVRAVGRITPSGPLLIAHDPEGGTQTDHVPGVGPASRTLAGLTLRKRVGLALDIGTGTGIQALQTAAHAERVIATDISERALEFARFNAALNGIHNIEFRQGSLFEPVAGESFDLITANPPFVISPDNAYAFRDAGMGRDDLSKTVVRGAARHLADGGMAAVLINWLHPKGDVGTEVRSWLEGTPCDAWLLHHQSDTPLRYAIRWNEWDRMRDEDAFLASVERWLDYFQSERVELIGSGAIVLRKRNGRNWFRLDGMPLAPKGQPTPHIERVFEANDRLSTLNSDESLLGQVYGLVDGHRLEQVMLYRDSEYTVDEIQVGLDNGVGVVGHVEPLAIHVLLRFDGEAPLGDILARCVDELGLDRDELVVAVTKSVRELSAAGFLAAPSARSGRDQPAPPTGRTASGARDSPSSVRP
jgi:methylase of polypeptide subunit release factors